MSWAGYDNPPWSESSDPTKYNQKMTSAHSLQLLINYYVTDETNIEKFYTFSFESKDHAGEHEDCDGDNDQDETKIFVSLMKSVDKTLETNEVSHHLEDS